LGIGFQNAKFPKHGSLVTRLLKAVAEVLEEVSKWIVIIIFPLMWMLPGKYRLPWTVHR